MCGCCSSINYLFISDTNFNTLLLFIPHVAQPNEGISLGKSKTNLLGPSSLGDDGGENKGGDETTTKSDADEQPTTKRLPIINPLVRLPHWPKYEQL